MLADRRGLHAEARTLELELAATGEAAIGTALATLAHAAERAAPLAVCREQISAANDARLGMALDLELARDAERGALDEARLKKDCVDRYLAVLGGDARSLAAALGLFRVSVRIADKGLERDALERMTGALPPSLLRSTTERRAIALLLAEGATDQGQARLAALADGGDDLAALYFLDEASPAPVGDAELARLARLIELSADPGQRAALRIALGAAEEARGRVGAAIAAYGEAARESSSDLRAERALERVRALGGDKQAELERHLRIAGTDEARAERSLVRAAALLAELGKPEEALARLDAALEHKATDGEALALYAMVASSIGASGRAAAHFASAADESSDVAFARSLRRRAAQLFGSAGDLGGALSMAARLEPGDAADLGRRIGDSDPARLRDFLGEVAERATPTEAARIHVERASLAPNAGAATEDLRRAISLDPQLRGPVALATRALRATEPDLCASLLAERFAAGTERAPIEQARTGLEVALALAEDGEDLEGAVAIPRDLERGRGRCAGDARAPSRRAPPRPRAWARGGIRARARGEQRAGGARGDPLRLVAHRAAWPGQGARHRAAAARVRGPAGVDRVPRRARAGVGVRW